VAERAGPVYPPCLEDPAAQRALRELEKVLARELPGTIVAVTWASCLWQRHKGKSGRGENHLGKDPWGEGSAKRIYVSIGGASVEEAEAAHEALQTRYVPGHRQRETYEKMAIGSYWQRFYEGYPEPERNPGKKCQPKDPPEGGFRSILEAVPEAKVHALQLATLLQQHYRQTKIGNNLLIIPPDERQELVTAGWTFQDEVNQVHKPKAA
jgi:hypothetical protein